MNKISGNSNLAERSTQGNWKALDAEREANLDIVRQAIEDFGLAAVATRIDSTLNKRSYPLRCADLLQEETTAGAIELCEETRPNPEESKPKEKDRIRREAGPQRQAIVKTLRDEIWSTPEERTHQREPLQQPQSKTNSVDYRDPPTQKSKLKTVRYSCWSRIAAILHRLFLEPSVFRM